MQSALIIPNAMATDSGLYRCRSEASMGENETIVIRLIITEDIRIILELINQVIEDTLLLDIDIFLYIFHITTPPSAD
ncbi:hypothetical protein STEG23_026420 [Scotinomys teguina]